MKNLSQALQIAASDSNSERLSLQQRIEAANKDVERAGDALQAARQKRALALSHLGSLQISHDMARKNLELLREHEIDLVSNPLFSRTYKFSHVDHEIRWI